MEKLKYFYKAIYKAQRIMNSKFIKTKVLTLPSYSDVFNIYLINYS